MGSLSSISVLTVSARWVYTRFYPMTNLFVCVIHELIHVRKSSNHDQCGSVTTGKRTPRFVVRVGAFYSIYRKEEEYVGMIRGNDLLPNLADNLKELKSFCAVVLYHL